MDRRIESIKQETCLVERQVNAKTHGFKSARVEVCNPTVLAYEFYSRTAIQRNPVEWA
jgi:hypothetical protein